MNPIDHKKLLNSKWTAVEPHNKEKHFMVIRCQESEDGRLASIDIQAIYSGQVYNLDWRELKDTNAWRIGWH